MQKLVARIIRKGGLMLYLGSELCGRQGRCASSWVVSHLAIHAKTFTWSMMPQVHVNITLYGGSVSEKSSCSGQMQSLNFGFATSREGRHVPRDFESPRKQKKNLFTYIQAVLTVQPSTFTCKLQHETTLFSAD